MNKLFSLSSTCLLLAGLMLGSAHPAWALDEDYFKGWNMRSHDPRRTGRSVVRGARVGNRVWEHIANDGYSINLEPTVTKEGVYFGTWGVVRGLGSRKKNWDKFDGKIYGLNKNTGRPLWSPISPGVTPYSYKYKGRPSNVQDGVVGPDMHLNWFNGTIEGTGCVDPLSGNIYFGRGDGKLYAINPKSGEILWKFKTLDPVRPEDPESGGEIVGGPLITESGLIIFGTFAGPPTPRRSNEVRAETSALYAVNRSGEMVWRYPASGTLGNPISAPPAMSPDGSRIYAVTNLIDEEEGGETLAVDTQSGKLIWKLRSETYGGQDIAIGINGTIYVAGMGVRQSHRASRLPVAFAVRDEGESGKLAWGPVKLDGEHPRSHMAGGVAIYEKSGVVQDLYMSTTISRASNSPGGLLHKLDPKSGKILSTWNPAKAKPECVGGLTDISLDNDGVIYVGVRGQRKGFTAPQTKGRLYSLEHNQGEYKVLFSYQTEANIDSASPAIGPAGGIYFGSTSKYAPIQVFSKYLRPTPPKQDIRSADPVFYGLMDAQ